MMNYKLFFVLLCSSFMVSVYGSHAPAKYMNPHYVCRRPGCPQVTGSQDSSFALEDESVSTNQNYEKSTASDAKRLKAQIEESNINENAMNVGKNDEFYY